MRRLIWAISAMMLAHAGDLPVREVVLYKSGVGWFERAGDLTAGDGVRLSFRAEDMNDVLKSLAVGGVDGNAIRGIRYDSAQPMEVRLAGFPFHVDAAQPLTALLDQLKGSRVEMKTGAETVSGAIVSAREIPAGEKQALKDEVTMLLDAGDLRVVDLSGVSALRFADPKLQALLRTYLETAMQGRSKELKSVYIDAAGERSGKISATYMIPMPTWKSSYRLLFGDDGATTLQGWAIIDNTTDDDWTNVRLAVVSGRPVSFISALYEPKYIGRVSADVGGDEAQAPVVYQGAMQMAQVMEAAPPPPPAASAAPAPAFKAKSVRERQMMQFRNVRVDTAGHEAGDLFEYRFAAPVTIQRNQSALIPFVEDKIRTRRLLVYAENYGEHPMSAAEITNSTGKTLDGGPITVFDGASYAGEALMEALKANEKRLISYAVDLGTLARTEDDDSGTMVREMHIHGGVLTMRNAEQTHRTYTLHNIDAKPKTVLIEHPIRGDYKLMDLKPVETTASAYRFEVKLAAGATEALAVKEERVYDTMTEVSSAAPDVVLSWTENKALTAEGRRQLQGVMAQQKVVADLREHVARLRAQSEDAGRQEERIRQNIASLNRVTGQQDQVQSYARQLAAEETRIAGLRDQTAAAEQRMEAEGARLKEIIEALDF